ncbi:hypothetical protein BVJ53_10450 [Lacticaseibacillus chiayiensis]|uniref:YueI family protein n=1 Tax=Lacticaseibacillus chiayiensis TaxID=2100821 RepID=A0A4V1P0I3_9LACO|nr:DUF1694 domain-containing protein [Lacticaseibacillus chiayiensis]QVI35671.1 DUF1694 domain-containing protein [Lacticaseibacillus chiayiensis]RXT20620.1 hypothetical protein BVJ53_10450 [Lacticaseibacillus chiayiensis]RXT58333.1 hypothetical protein CHT97_07190 [Lacticaseibacillus chiayiensis]UYN57505.1 YueI family protein [Lacticaseibacillus chiayiensis]
MAEDLEHFIKIMALGIPTIKPDEKRAFLGNFRERVALAVTIQQLRDARITAMLDSVLTRYPGYRVFLNGRMGESLVNQYMLQALAHQYPFTIMNQPGMRVIKRVLPTDFGWVLAHPTQKISRPILL